MNYKLHYNKLVNRGKERFIDGYTEMHHIIPRCMGGTDLPDNLVKLTAREHFVAHLLLLRMYPQYQYKLIKAVNMMCVVGSNHDRSMNRMYGWLREKFSHEMSINQTGDKNSQHGTKWIHNTQLRESKKISKDEVIPDGWKNGRIVDFDKYNKKQQVQLERRHLKDKLKKQREIEKIEKQQEYKNRLDKTYILSLYDDFKSGDYYSISQFHKKNNIQVSRMTLTNYWREWIPEYKANSKEGKRFRLK
jgi:hypothetical protein